jgi:KUP system potassium uptake protein
MFYVVRHQSQKPLWLVAAGAGFLLTIDLLFLAANLTKITHGAWLPLVIAIIAFKYLRDHKPPVTRVPGTAVFLNRNKITAPLAMRASVEHLHALNEHVMILSIHTLAVPHVTAADRLVIDDLGYTDDGITHATARFGYMDQPNVPAIVRQIEGAPIESPIDINEVS